MDNTEVTVQDIELLSKIEENIEKKKIRDEFFLKLERIVCLRGNE